MVLDPPPFNLLYLYLYLLASWPQDSFKGTVPVECGPHIMKKIGLNLVILIFGNKILTSWVRTRHETCHEVHYDTSLIR